MSDPYSNLSPRRLPHPPNLEQLKKQAKEVLERFRAGDSTAVAEIRQFERDPDPCHFALNDAQRVLARAYGFQSWPKLKAFVDGATIARYADAVKAGDILREGVDPNVARMGATILHFTAARGGLDGASRARFAAMLIDHGARLDLRDDLLNSTPLGWACRWGRLEMAEMLVARGAPVEETATEPWATPNAWAKRMNHSQILSLLDGTSGARHRHPA